MLRANVIKLIFWVANIMFLYWFDQKFPDHFPFRFRSDIFFLTRAKMSESSFHPCDAYPTRMWMRGHRYQYAYKYAGYGKHYVTAVFEDSIVQLRFTAVDDCSAVVSASHAFAMAPTNGFTTAYRILLRVRQGSTSELCLINVTSHPETAESCLKNNNGHLLTKLRAGEKLSFTVYL